MGIEDTIDEKAREMAEKTIIKKAVIKEPPKQDYTIKKIAFYKRRWFKPAAISLVSLIVTGTLLLSFRDKPVQYVPIDEPVAITEPITINQPTTAINEPTISEPMPLEEKVSHPIIVDYSKCRNENPSETEIKKDKPPETIVGALAQIDQKLVDSISKTTSQEPSLKITPQPQKPEKKKYEYTEENIQLANRVNSLIGEATELVLKKDYNGAISNYNQLLKMECEIAGYNKYDICRKAAKIYSYYKAHDKNEGITYSNLDQIEYWNRKALKYNPPEGTKGAIYDQLHWVYIYRDDKKGMIAVFDEWIKAIPNSKDSLTKSKERELKNWEWLKEHYASKVKR